MKKPASSGLRPLTNPSIFSAGLFFWTLVVLSWVLRRGEVGGLWPSCHGWSGWLGERHCDLLDVLGGCGQQALACDTGETSEAGIAMAVKLLGIGKRALDRLLAALALPQGVRRLASVRWRASAQTWRVMVRTALVFDVQEASSGQVWQIAGSDV